MRTVSMEWNLRQVMADRGIFQTSELVPLLADRDIHLSREHVYRLVTNTPSASTPTYSSPCATSWPARPTISSCPWSIPGLGPRRPAPTRAQRSGRCGRFAPLFAVPRG